MNNRPHALRLLESLLVNRRQIRAAWWALLGTVGLPERRWHSFPAWERRAIKLGVVGLLAAVIFGALYGFAGQPRSRGAGYVMFAVLALLYIPSWSRYRVPLVPGAPRARVPGRFVLPLAVLAIVATYPFYFGHLPGLPIFQAFPSLETAFTMAIFVMMALGLNVVVGYAGLLDLGYVAFYAIGAYAAGWFASPHAFRWHVNFTFGGVGVQPGVGGIHISIWLVLIIAAILTAVAGVIIGVPTLRLRGDYLAIVTLGFGEIVYVVANNGDCLIKGLNGGHCVNVTNGPQGINPIDSPGFGGWLHNHLGFPHVFNTSSGPTLNSPNLYLWAAIALVLFVVFCSLRLRDSKLGRAWVAIREDETAAAAMGVPLMRTKTWAYAIGAFFGGIAGAFLKSRDGGAFPGDFLFQFSIFVLCMIILGGMGSIWGVILGGSFLAYLNLEGIANVGSWLNSSGISGTLFGHDIDASLYASGIYGTILVLVMLFRPTGLIPSARRKAEFELGVADEPLVDVRAASAE